MIVKKSFVSITMVAMETGKTLSVIIVTVFVRKNALSRT